MAKGFMTRRGGSKGISTSYLYNEGNENNAITGGWEGVKASSCGTTCTFSKQTDHLYAYAQGGNGSTSNPRESTVWWTTANAINLTDMSKVKIELTDINKSAQYAGVELHVYSSKVSSSTGWVTPSASVGNINANGIYEINVSSLSGLYYVTIMHYASYNTSDRYVGSKTEKIWLE